MPRRAPVRLTADGRYILYVNGQEVSRGPIRAEPGQLFWDRLDISAHLRAGANMVTALVRHYGLPVPWWMPTKPHATMSRGGFLLESPSLPALSTGAGWRVRRGPWDLTRRLQCGSPIEVLDARRLPEGWPAPTDDPAAWDDAAVIGGAEPGQRPPFTPFSVMEPNPLPSLGGGTRSAQLVGVGHVAGDVAEIPAIVSEGYHLDPLYSTRGQAELLRTGGAPPLRLEQGDVAVFDLGVVSVGLPVAIVDADPGTTITLRAGEVLDGATPVDPFRTWAHLHICRGGERERIAPMDGLGLRFATVTVDGPAVLHGVDVVEQRYPFDQVGSFECDDELLNEVWRIGRRTLEVCATDAYLDCPSREQRAWVGDAYVHQMLTHVVSGDQRLARRCLRLGASARRQDGLLSMIAGGDAPVTRPDTMPMYSLYWVRALERYHLHTGDLDTVIELLPVAQGVCQWFLRHVDDGQLDHIAGTHFVEWALGPTDPLCTPTALLVLALDAVATLATAAGDTGTAARHAEAADALRATMRARFFDVQAQAWVEGGGEPRRSQHAAALAFLCGAATCEEASSQLAAVMAPSGNLIQCSPFFAHWLHEALGRAGRIDLLTESIRRWKVFVDGGDGTVWEHWEVGPGVSHAHAWSATPTYDLPTFVLGVQPASPGFGEITVSPTFGPLTRLKGSVPTPHGAVTVDLRRSSGEIVGTVALPPGSRGLLTLDEADMSMPLREGENSVTTPVVAAGRRRP